MSLPSLPLGIHSVPSLPRVYNVLQDIYSHAESALEPLNKHRILLNMVPIINKALPILEALEEADDDFPNGWLNQCAVAFADVFKQLQHVEDQADGQCVYN
jgi:hypothetical protein